LEDAKTKRIWQTLFAVLFVVSQAPLGYSANQSSPVGTIAYIRVYQQGAGNLQLQIGVNVAVRNCGTLPNVYYFNSSNSAMNMDVVKAVLAEASLALAAGKNVTMTYDCTLGAGGYGYGTAIQVGP